MLSDLEFLIRLQQMDDFVADARRFLSEYPERVRALDEQLTGARQRLDQARERLAASQAERRALDKNLAEVQGRLSRFKDQIMEVKTNREYQAMQSEIETAQREVRQTEDRILEKMLEADELASAVESAKSELAKEEARIEAERLEMKRQASELERELERSVPARADLARQISAPSVALYEQVFRSRKGIAVAPARDGHCTVCHVRLTPQKFNDIRRNEAIVQCDSCQRILYFPNAGDAGVVSR